MMRIQSTVPDPDLTIKGEGGGGALIQTGQTSTTGYLSITATLFARQSIY